MTDDDARDVPKRWPHTGQIEVDEHGTIGSHDHIRGIAMNEANARDKRAVFEDPLRPDVRRREHLSPLRTSVRGGAVALDARFHHAERIPEGRHSSGRRQGVEPPERLTEPSPVEGGAGRLDERPERNRTCRRLDRTVGDRVGGWQYRQACLVDVSSKAHLPLEAVPRRRRPRDPGDEPMRRKGDDGAVPDAQQALPLRAQAEQARRFAERDLRPSATGHSDCGAVPARVAANAPNDPRARGSRTREAPARGS